MIYLARNGKVFGPFTSDQLREISFQRYSWILDLRCAAPAWTAIDPAPPAPAVLNAPAKRRALVFSPHFPAAIRGELDEVQIDRGKLFTTETQVRIEPGTPVHLQIDGKKSSLARIEKVQILDASVIYLLSWNDEDAPGL